MSRSILAVLWVAVALHAYTGLPPDAVAAHGEGTAEQSNQRQARSQHGVRADNQIGGKGAIPVSTSVRTVRATPHRLRGPARQSMRLTSTGRFALIPGETAGGSVREVAWTPDGYLLASIGTRLYLLELQPDQSLETLDSIDTGEPVNGVALAGDAILAAHNSGVIGAYRLDGTRLEPLGRQQWRETPRFIAGDDTMIAVTDRAGRLMLFDESSAHVAGMPPEAAAVAVIPEVGRVEDLMVEAGRAWLVTDRGLSLVEKQGGRLGLRKLLNEHVPNYWVGRVAASGDRVIYGRRHELQFARLLPGGGLELVTRHTRGGFVRAAAIRGDNVIASWEEPFPPEASEAGVYAGGFGTRASDWSRLAPALPVADAAIDGLGQTAIGFEHRGLAVATTDGELVFDSTIPAFTVERVAHIAGGGRDGEYAAAGPDGVAVIDVGPKGQFGALCVTSTEQSPSHLAVAADSTGATAFVAWTTQDLPVTVVQRFALGGCPTSTGRILLPDEYIGDLGAVNSSRILVLLNDELVLVDVDGQDGFDAIHRWPRGRFDVDAESGHAVVNPAHGQLEVWSVDAEPSLVQSLTWPAHESVHDIALEWPQLYVTSQHGAIHFANLTAATPEFRRIGAGHSALTVEAIIDQGLVVTYGSGTVPKLGVLIQGDDGADGRLVEISSPWRIHGVAPLAKDRYLGAAGSEGLLAFDLRRLVRRVFVPRVTR